MSSPLAMTHGTFIRSALISIYACFFITAKPTLFSLEFTLFFCKKCNVIFDKSYSFYFKLQIIKKRGICQSIKYTLLWEGCTRFYSCRGGGSGVGKVPFSLKL